MVRKDIQITEIELEDCLKRHNLNEHELVRECIKYNSHLIKKICILCGATNLSPIDKKCYYCGEYT